MSAPLGPCVAALATLDGVEFNSLDGFREKEPGRRAFRERRYMYLGVQLSLKTASPECKLSPYLCCIFFAFCKHKVYKQHNDAGSV